MKQGCPIATRSICGDWRAHAGSSVILRRRPARRQGERRDVERGGTLGTWNSFIAIGDSFTEGLDDWRPDGTPRGWADRVAERLAADAPGFRVRQPRRARQAAGPDRRRPGPGGRAAAPDLIAFCGRRQRHHPVRLRHRRPGPPLRRRARPADRHRGPGHGVHRVRPGPDAPAHPPTARPGGLLQRADAGQRGAARQHGGRPVGHGPAGRSALLGPRPAAPDRRGPPPGGAAHAGDARRAGARRLAGAAARRPTPPRGGPASRRTCAGCATS